MPFVVPVEWVEPLQLVLEVMPRSVVEQSAFNDPFEDEYDV